MKKILFLLLISAASYGQAIFDEGIQLNGNQASTTATKVVLQDLNGDLNYSQITGFQKEKAYLSTGLLKNGALMANGDPTKFNITAGIGIISNFDDPQNPVSTLINFPAFTGITPTYLLTGNITYVAINSTPAVVMQATPFTDSQRRDLIELGAVIHSNLATINVINNLSSPSNAGTNQLHDFMDFIGALNLTGNKYSANGVNLQLDKSAGMIGKRGVNFVNDWKDPHRLSQSAETSLTFRYRTQNGTEGTDRINLDPALYDLNNVLTAVPNNKFTIQTVVMFQTGLTRILYGQTVYDDLAMARSAIFTRSFVIESNAKENGIIRGYIIMRNTTTSLLNPIDATILDAQKFGGIASGGVALTNSSIIAALGYTPENVANKQNSLAVDGSGFKYPTVDAVSSGTAYKRTIVQIRAFTGTLSNNNFYTTDTGQEGNWYYDAADTTSADNTGTILVTADGKRIKRVFNDNIADITWFGSALNLDAYLQLAATSGITAVRLKNNVNYTLTTQINCTNDFSLIGNGSVVTTALPVSFSFSPANKRFTLKGVFLNLDSDTNARSNATTTQPQYFNGQLYGENNRSSTKSIVDIQNFGNQTDGLINGDPAFIFHHYSDHKMFQIDNVGAGNVLTLVNAHNSTRRSDKALDYVGIGNYLDYRFVNPLDPSFIEQSGYFVDKDFRQVLTGSRTTAASRAFTMWNNKIDDGYYAFYHQTTNSHANIDHWGGGSNDLGVTKSDGVRFLTDVNYSRFKFQNTLTNGIAIEPLQGPITLLPGNTNKTINAYGRIEFPNTYVGSFQVNKTDDAQYGYNFNIVNRHANIMNIGNGTIDRFRLKYDSATDRIKQEVTSGAGGYLIEAMSGELQMKGVGNVNFLSDIKIETSPTISAGTYNVLTYNPTSKLVEKVSSDFYAKKDNAALTGIPTAPTATVGTNTTQIATTAFVQANKNKLVGYTVATLPAGIVGDTAYVTDAVGFSYNSILVGGGAGVTMAFFDGTNWRAH